MDDVVAAAAKADVSKICGGKLTTTSESMWSDEGGDVTVSNYDYGSDVFHMTGSDWSGDYDLYLLLDTDGSIVAIKRDSENELSKDYTSYEAASLPFMDYLGYGTNAYSAESLIQSLAAKANENPNNDLKFSYSNGAYNFSFGFPYSSWYYYTANVSFMVSDGALTNAGVEILQYGSEAFVTDDENGTTSLVEDASFESRKLYAIEQNVGERTYSSPYTLDYFSATSYTLTDYEGVAIGDTFTVESGDYVQLKMTAISPSTANFDFDAPKITVSGGTGLSISYASYNGPTLYLDASTVGTYAVKIKTRKVTKAFNVVVETPKPSAISASCYTLSPSGYDWADITDNSLSGYAGVTYYLAPSVTPYEASQEVTASVDASAGDFDLAKTIIYTYAGSTTPVSVYAFSANKAGTYPLTIKSAVDDDVSCTVTITIAEAPSFKDILGVDSGFAYREGGAVKCTFDFLPTNDDGSVGSVTIKDVTSGKTETATYAIAKNETTGMHDCALTHVSGDDLISSFTLVIAPDFTPYVSFDYDGYIATYALSPATLEFYLVQNWKGVSDDMTFTARFWESGTVDLRMVDSDWIANYYYSATYTIAETPSENGYAVTLSLGEDQYDSPFFALPSAFYLSSDFKTLSASFTCDGVDYSFSLAYAAAGRGD